MKNTVIIAEYLGDHSVGIPNGHIEVKFDWIIDKDDLRYVRTTLKELFEELTDSKVSIYTAEELEEMEKTEKEVENMGITIDELHEALIKEFKGNKKAEEVINTAFDFTDTLKKFISLLQERENAHNVKYFSNLEPEQFSYTVGKKYVRVIRGTSAYCFVDVNTGDIYKAASYKAPAKHARGNIYNDNPLDGTGVYGADYLK